MNTHVVYSARTGRIRRIIFDDKLTNTEMLVNFPIANGEAVAQNIVDPNVSLEELQTILSDLTGIVPSDDRYVLVTQAGNITGAIIADPDAGDSVSRHTLVAHATADIGWRQMRDGSFQRPLLIIANEITVKNHKIAMYGGNTWTERMLRNGMPRSQINTERRRLIAIANAAITTLETERTARIAAR